MLAESCNCPALRMRLKSPHRTLSLSAEELVALEPYVNVTKVASINFLHQCICMGFPFGYYFDCCLLLEEYSA